GHDRRRRDVDQLGQLRHGEELVDPDGLRFLRRAPLALRLTLQPAGRLLATVAPLPPTRLELGHDALHVLLHGLLIHPLPLLPPPVLLPPTVQREALRLDPDLATRPRTRRRRRRRRLPHRRRSHRRRPRDLRQRLRHPRWRRRRRSGRRGRRRGRRLRRRRLLRLLRLLRRRRLLRFLRLDRRLGFRRHLHRRLRLRLDRLGLLGLRCRGLYGRLHRRRRFGLHHDHFRLGLRPARGHQLRATSRGFLRGLGRHRFRSVRCRRRRRIRLRHLHNFLHLHTATTAPAARRTMRILQHRFQRRLHIPLHRAALPLETRAQLRNGRIVDLRRLAAYGHAHLAEELDQRPSRHTELSRNFLDAHILSHHLSYRTTQFLRLAYIRPTSTDPSASPGINRSPREAAPGSASRTPRPSRPPRSSPHAPPPRPAGPDRTPPRTE